MYLSKERKRRKKHPGFLSSKNFLLFKFSKCTLRVYVLSRTKANTPGRNIVYSVINGRLFTRFN